MRNLNSRFFVIMAGLLWAACATAPVRGAPPPGWRPVFTATETDATIVFEPAVLAPGKDTASVGLVGTFNSWNTDQLWALEKQADGTWRESYPRHLIGVPGNSGVTEFQFILNGSERITANGAGAPAGQKFANNFVILWPGFTEALIAERDAENQVLKTEYASAADLANFRELAGGRLPPGRLYRSYHPFLPSQESPLEKDRLAAVQKLMEEKRIASVINLSDPSAASDDASMPQSYRALATQGRVLFAPTHYNVVYFASDSPEFTAELKQVLAFVAATPGPYLLHCRLGTDRTGVVTALLSGLTGVPWPVILEDFLKSNQLGIREYRAPELLTYSITQFLGRSPADVLDLASALRVRMVEKGIAPATVDQAVARLTEREARP